MNHYLLEIGMEEMPASAILPAQKQLESLIKTYCTQSKIHFQTIQGFSTPRRLAVLVQQIENFQEDRHLTSKGPSLEIAQNSNGVWTQAARGFAKKHGLLAEQLQIQEDKGKKFVFVRQTLKGEESKKLFQSQLQKWILELSFPKSMRWGNSKLSYVRPIHWIVSLWNDEVLPVQIEGIQAGRTTYGLQHTDTIEITNAQHYPSSFDNVIVSYDLRKQAIVEQIRKLEQTNQFHVDLDEDLLHETTNLVENPTVLQGCFNQDFLNVPAQALSTAMSTHQRYFSVYDAQGQMLPQFILVAQCSKHAQDTVVKGNEKVLNARLKDAQFFYENDCKHKPNDFVQQLASVTFFHNKGSLLDRTTRLVQQVEQICSSLFDHNNSTDSEKIATSKRVAELAFFDLQTQMVYEFPELQGVMAEQYALLHGESPQVARGLKERYLPKFYGDILPSDPTTLPVALAEKMDLIATIFSTGKKPSGSSDPYALRRAANGIIQILFEKKISLSLKQLIPNFESLENLTIFEDLVHFFKERLTFAMKQQGMRHDFIESVTAKMSLDSKPYWQLCLAQGLLQFSKHKQFKQTIESVVRVVNIVQTNLSEVENQDLDWNDELAQTDQERELFKKVTELQNRDLFEKALDGNNATLEEGNDGQHEPVFQTVSSQFFQGLLMLEPCITAFFDAVMILDQDEKVRKNRLWLCLQIVEQVSERLDLKKIELV